MGEPLEFGLRMIHPGAVIPGVKKGARMLMRRWMGCKSLVCVVLASMVLGGISPVWAGGASQLPPSLNVPDNLYASLEEEMETMDNMESAPLFYMPDVYTTHMITGYGAVALTLLAMISGDDSSLHKVSGMTAAAFGVAAGTTGHIAYGEGIDFRDGWTRENIHAGSGYLATAALVLTAVLGAADESHSGVGGLATAAVAVPVLVFAF